MSSFSIIKRKCRKCDLKVVIGKPDGSCQCQTPDVESTVTHFADLPKRGLLSAVPAIAIQ